MHYARSEFMHYVKLYLNVLCAFLLEELAKDTTPLPVQ